MLKAASYLEDDDELEKNFEGQRNTYKRSPRKLGTDDLDKNSELQEYQGMFYYFFLINYIILYMMTF